MVLNSGLKMFGKGDEMRSFQVYSRNRPVFIQPVKKPNRPGVFLTVLKGLLSVHVCFVTVPRVVYVAAVGHTWEKPVEVLFWTFCQQHSSLRHRGNVLQVV